MERWISLLGVFAFLGIAYLLSDNRKKISFRLVFWGMLLQIIFAVLILGIPLLGVPGVLRFVFDGINDLFLELLTFTDAGAGFVFGGLIDDKRYGMIIAFKVLPSIIFFSSLMAIGYYLGIMQKIVHAMSKLMLKTMGTSGAESLASAANIFVGQTEAPLLIRPYVEKMTRSELMAVMTGGMANIAGGVMAAYVFLLKDKMPDIAGHLMTASVMSAPVSLMMAKIMVPETEVPLTLGKVNLEETNLDANGIDAAARGASEGVQLAINVAAMLIAFIALIAMGDAMLSKVGEWFGFAQLKESFPFLFPGQTPAKLTLEWLFGIMFAPLAWLMGIPSNEILIAGNLLGQKTILNEFVAYLSLSQISATLSPRTMIITSYALCGFANFASIAIQIGGIGPLAPSRKGDIAKLGVKSLIGGTLTTFCMASLAGFLIE